MPRTVLGIVQRHFPKVTKVIDAKQNLEIEVLGSDDKSSKRKNHEECAMAVACKRAYHADGVIISRSMAYLIKGNVAVRFTVPEAVSREIVAFDRGGNFSTGSYVLNAPSKGNTMEARAKYNKRRKDKNTHTGESKKKRRHQLTGGIRAVLGGIDDKG